MKRVNGTWYYLGRAYASLHEAMLAVREVYLMVLAVQEVLSLARAG